ncbi:sensor histidine kinase [Sphingopyxis witflariensis]|uniref:sensor histidine kinase n=1 Tax=Sphingopyxis witflariensis TaxID=173675 RepID=UPI00191C8810|nr:ATP-binding protein [Sphingopyxis witflariensis]
MARERSIIDELRTGFAWMAVAGSIILAVFLVVDFELLRTDIRETYGHIGIAHEVIDHVIFPIIVLLVPLAVATRWLIGRALEPLHEAAERIHQATGRERGFRVTLADFPTEALSFADAVNALLSRLDDAARRQEGFAADVAHELKTPLAVAMLELGRLKSAEADRVIDDLAAMNRLIEQLLVLAQLDAYAAAPQPFRPIDLKDPALDAIKLCAVNAAQKGVALAYREEGGSPVMGRVEAVTAALRNLVDNAVRVTATGGEVAIVRGPGAKIRVIDGGPGIDRERLLALSDRFRRGEHASYGGAGLGLSIVARIMEVHGGAMGSHPGEPSIELDFEPDVTI